MILNIVKMAWRNIWRNRRRTLITMSAIVIGIISMIFLDSYFGGVINSSSEAMIKTQWGHVRIAHNEYLRLERILPKEFLVEDLESIKKSLFQIPEVTVVEERLKLNVLLSHGDKNEPALAVGITPEIAKENMDLDKMVVDGSYFQSDKLELIIGSTLAEILGVKVGDELLLVTTDINFSTYALPFRIAGLFSSGYPNMDKHMLYIPLENAQEMLDCGDSAHELLVFTQDTNTAVQTSQKIINALNRLNPDHQYSAIAWQKSDFMEMMPVLENMMGKISGIIMLVVGLVILNTMLMSVMERYHEIGVIKAMGFKNREVMGMILTEAFYVGAIGSIIGGIFGSALSIYVEHTGLNLVKMMGEEMWNAMDMPVPFFGQVLYPDFTIQILIGALVFGVFISLLAVLYPAIKSARMLPVEAFRSELKV